VPFTSRTNYSNWELSADRALAFRRRLLALKVKDEQIVRVAGYASQRPYLPDDPKALQNRRISVTLLSDYTAEAIKDAKEKARRDAAREAREAELAAQKTTK